MKRPAVYIALLLVSLVTSNYSFAQKLPHVKLGPIDAYSLSVLQILGTPELTCKENDGEVLSYTLRISKRQRDAYGPYYVTGSRLPENVQQLLKTIHSRRGKLYFEDIRVRYNGKEITLPDDYIVEYYQGVDRRSTFPSATALP